MMTPIDLRVLRFTSGHHVEVLSFQLQEVLVNVVILWVKNLDVYFSESVQLVNHIYVKNMTPFSSGGIFWNNKFVTESGLTDEKDLSAGTRSLFSIGTFGHN